MELVNHTALPAELLVADLGDRDDGQHQRSGFLVAKATYETRSGVELVTSDPLPILHAPTETALGLLPADVRGRRGGPVEMVVLACAHARGGRPVESMTVELRIGSFASALLVSGDRSWVGTGEHAEPGPATPFAQMPLTWERAYGGSSEVWLDALSSVPLQHQYNALGCGIDPARLAAQLADGQCSKGYPRFEPRGPLPNVEDPATSIRAWADDPLPSCWATVPGELGMRAALLKDIATPSELNLETKERLNEEMQRFSHPDIRSETLPVGAELQLTGCTPEGAWGFRIPRLTVAADYRIAERSGQLQLAPTIVTLLPEERRFTITYETWFRYHVRAQEERSMRLSISGDP